jgi:hypothetical protein
MIAAIFLAAGRHAYRINFYPGGQHFPDGIKTRALKSFRRRIHPFLDNIADSHQFDRFVILIAAGVGIADTAHSNHRNIEHENSFVPVKIQSPASLWPTVPPKRGAHKRVLCHLCGHYRQHKMVKNLHFFAMVFRPSRSGQMLCGTGV